MSRFKIFTETQLLKAENKINDWLEKNPDVYIIRWQYQQDRMGDYSICIEYDTFSSVFNNNEDLLMKGERKQDDQ